MNIQRFRHAFFHRCLGSDDIRFFNSHAMLFDLGGTAKSRNFAHVRARRRRVNGSLAFGGSKVHWFVYYLLNLNFITAEIVEARVPGPLNERAHARSHLSFLDLYPTYHPTGGVQVLQKA
jgi:hypothetical protein